MHTSPKPSGRNPLLTRLKKRKMARSAHAYVRGNTVKFYDWLNSKNHAALPNAPPVWICGDCHVGNLGPLAAADGRVDIQIRDLDQTVIGNPVHDLVRLGLSLAIAARGCDLPGVTTSRMLEEMTIGYVEALDYRVSKQTIRKRQADAIGGLMKRALRRNWRQLAEERIEDVRPTIPRGEKFWELSRAEAQSITDLISTTPVRELVTSLNSRKSDSKLELLDAAYWVKGCSSLGRLRYAVLVGVGKRHKPHKGGICFLDIKEAAPSASPRTIGEAMPRDNAQRVVAGARALSPNLGERMIASKLLGRSVVIRELMPQDLKLEVDTLTQVEAVLVARYLSGVVGHAHARQMDEKTRQIYRRELGRRHSKSLDAPSWLWTAVVELIAYHEEGYLEHCRRYAA